jgi:DNA repair exonuclease SbcCD ATPase subunit
MQDQVDELVNRLHSLYGVYKTYDRQVTSLTVDVENLSKKAFSLEKVAKFFQRVATDEQQKLQEWFEQIITYGFNVVFGEGVYRFKIGGPELKGNEITLSFDIVERVGDIDYNRDPYNEMGGGVADVLSFLLQFVVLFLSKDKVRPVLFLDESMKHLSNEFRPAMASLMRELAERTAVQIVMVTHENLFLEAADTAYQFYKVGLATQAERLK